MRNTKRDFEDMINKSANQLKLFYIHINSKTKSKHQIITCKTRALSILKKNKCVRLFKAARNFGTKT